ncbi:hypothetical protein IWQ62_006453 [Dispira parvispora]|uniref:Chitin-binding type-4 domain-containing protein n=1 Tax=Dispira parvispora TaxID=1520584 RepID=A0A9W8AHR6_9FUNG|nr:hypothetical protein IWQ62_006453 [Dispira parvispora]
MRSFAFAALAALVGSATAHTWADCVDFTPNSKENALKGDCSAFPRGYPGRTNANINTEYTYLFSATPGSQPICQPGRQSSPSYTEEYPMGKASPGETKKVSYEVNGHQNKFADTKVQVMYFPDRDLQTVDYNERDKAQILGEWKFTENCYQPLHDNQVCWGSYTLPDELPADRISLVFFWWFEENPAGQEYSTCFDLSTGAGGSSGKNTSASATDGNNASPTMSNSSDGAAPTDSPAGVGQRQESGDVAGAAKQVKCRNRRRGCKGGKCRRRR